MPDEGPAPRPPGGFAAEAVWQQALQSMLMQHAQQQYPTRGLCSVSVAFSPLGTGGGHPLQNLAGLVSALPIKTPEELAAWDAECQKRQEEAQAAERRGFALLETAIGADAAAKVAAGGGYEIPSRRMSGRLKRQSYLVCKEGRVKILRDGLPVGESCIVSDSRTPWPDQVLHKIKAIQADETVVFATGNVTMVRQGRR